MPANQKVRAPRIGTTTAAVMIFFAVLLDAIQFIATFLNIIPGLGVAVNWFIAIFAAIAFGLWFTLSGINYFSGKQAARKTLIAFSSVIIELLPIIDALPAITSGVVLMIVVSRIEDAEKNMDSEKTKKMVSIAKFAQTAARRVPMIDGLQRSFESSTDSQMRKKAASFNRGREFDAKDQLYDPRIAANDNEREQKRNAA